MEGHPVRDAKTHIRGKTYTRNKKTKTYWDQSVMNATWCKTKGAKISGQHIFTFTGAIAPQSFKTIHW